MTDADLDLLAYDIADLIDRGDYRLDVTQAEVRAALPVFLDALAAPIEGFAS